jgi:hypothetical protein
VNRDHTTDDEARFVLRAGPLGRASLRDDVLAFCARNGLSCEITQRSDRLLSTRMTFRVRGEQDAITSLMGYLQWTGRTPRAAVPGSEPR